MRHKSDNEQEADPDGEDHRVSGNNWVSKNDYWDRQSSALSKAKSRQSDWIYARRKRQAEAGTSWKRITLTLPRSEAKQKAREFFTKYPKAAYWSEVESWRELPGDIIEFTMRRLPSAD